MDIIIELGANVFPKFTKWKNVNKNTIKNKFYRKILLNEVSKKLKSIKSMKEDFKTVMENLLPSTTFFKGVVLEISISFSVIKQEKLVLKRHQKKLDNLLKEKNKLNDIYDNPNIVVTNFSSHALSNKEYSILKFGLKYGLVTRPNESNI